MRGSCPGPSLEAVGWPRKGHPRDPPAVGGLQPGALAAGVSTVKLQGVVMVSGSSIVGFGRPLGVSMRGVSAKHARPVLSLSRPHSRVSLRRPRPPQHMVNSCLTISDRADMEQQVQGPISSSPTVVPTTDWFTDIGSLVPVIPISQIMLPGARLPGKAS